MIYSVKRFSSVDIIDQKEFGIISDGVKKLKTKILLHQALRDKKLLKRTKEALDNKKSVNIGKNKRKLLYITANEKGAGVVGLPKETPSYSRTPELPRTSEKRLNLKVANGTMKEAEKRKFLKRRSKANKRISEGKYKEGLIIHQGPGDEELAHEIGHLLNRVDSKPKSPSFLGRVKSLLTSKVSPELMEEHEASKRGLEILRKAGASKKDLKLAKKNLDLAEDTYRLSERFDKRKHKILKEINPEDRNEVMNKLSH